MTADDPRNIHYFVSLVAQHDNLGDLVIRRQAYEYVRSVTGTVHLLTEGMPAGFLEPFVMDADVVLHTDRASFAAALIKSAVRHRAVVVLSPGPQHARAGVSGLMAQSAAAVRAALVRACGGSTIAIGRSVLDLHGKVRLALERATVLSMDGYITRDGISAHKLRTSRVTLAPDVAFGNAPTTERTEDGTLVAFSFRSDYSPSIENLRRVADSVRMKNLEPVMVSQVRRDDDQHARLADALACDAVLWGERSHAEQLLRVQETYGRSVATLSNRLHALIFGACRGAVPIAVADSSSSKAVVTLRGVIDVRSVTSSFDNVELALSDATDPGTREKLAADVADARRRIDAAAWALLTAGGVEGGRT